MSPSRMSSNLKMWTSFSHWLLRSCVCCGIILVVCVITCLLRWGKRWSSGSNALNQVHCYWFFKTKDPAETMDPDWPLSLHSGRPCLGCGTHCNWLAMWASTAGKEGEKCVWSRWNCCGSASKLAETNTFWPSEHPYQYPAPKIVPKWNRTHQSYVPRIVLRKLYVPIVRTKGCTKKTVPTMRTYQPYVPNIPDPLGTAVTLFLNLDNT